MDEIGHQQDTGGAIKHIDLRSPDSVDWNLSKVASWNIPIILGKQTSILHL